MSNDIEMEDGDLVIIDGSEYRTTTVALSLWSDGSVKPASGRGRVTWYSDRRPNSGDSSYRIIDQAPTRQ